MDVDSSNISAAGRAKPPAEPLRLPVRKTLGHTPPDWVPDASLYFVTICAVQRGSDDLIRDGRGYQLVESVRVLHRQGAWYVQLFLAMPDHVHMLVAVGRETQLGARMTAWKGYAAKSLNIRWQSGFFDHRLRSPAALDEKAFYIRQNPVRAGLVTAPNDWPYVFSAADEIGSAGTPRPTKFTHSHA